MVVDVKHFILGFTDGYQVPNYLLESSREALDDVLSYAETRRPSLFVEMYFRCNVLTIIGKLNGGEAFSFRQLSPHLWISEESLSEFVLESNCTYTVDISYQFEHDQLIRTAHGDGHFVASPNEGQLSTASTQSH